MNYDEVVNLINLMEKSKFNTCEINFENTYLNLSKLDSPIVKQNHVNPVELTSPIEVSNVNKETVTPKIEDINIEEKKSDNNENDIIVTSPIVGTYYESAKVGDQPFANIGDEVKEGDTLCIVEAMKVMNEVKSKVNGKVRKVLLEDGSLVEFGQPLFIIEKI